MSDEIESRPDQLVVNKVVRILSGKPQKYTVHLLMKDGSERQLQTNYIPVADWCSEARDLMLAVGVVDDYKKVPLCLFSEVAIIQVEENAT